jgi:hypothetical protein
MSAPVENLVQRLNARRSGRGWIAKCPAHDDRTPSLSISEGADGRALCKCFAGCTPEEIVAALGMTMSDLFPEGSRRESRAVAKPVAPQPKETVAPRRVVTPRPLGELLDAVCATLRRYVVFPLQEQATVIAVWIVHAWLFRAADYAPYLFIFSASKRSGKTRVLEILELLSPNAELTPRRECGRADSQR